MQILLTLLVAAAAHSTLHAQSLTLFDIDASAHPTMRAKFYAFDAQGNVQRPLAAELAITEDGVSRTITNVTCPTPAPPRALSSVLVVDVSGSMSGSINNTSKIDLAQSAARSWVNALPLGNSECALVSFNEANYLNQDFTTDRTKLLAAIDKLRPFGGTNYNKALFEPTAGGLLVSKNGKHQRLIILVTDGHAPNPDISAIISEANRQSCIIFCVTLGLPAPQSLRTIATQSGGEVFENVTTIEQAELVYRNIMATAQNSTPCSIEWQSVAVCNVGDINVGLNLQSQTAKARYMPPSTAVAKLEFSPTPIRFDHPPSGTPITQTVTVTARNAAFTVTSITSSNPAYTLTPTSFTLQPNESRTLTLTHTAADSGYTFARFALENALCPQVFFASGGYPGIRPKTPTLKLTHPNGGENFVVGSDTVITWEGIPPTVLVELHYSTNKGASWKRIDTARGLTYRWNNVPRPPSNACLVRVRQLADSVSGGSDAWSEIRTLRGHTHHVLRVAFSPDGAMLASTSHDKTFKLWDPLAGDTIRTLWGHTDSPIGVAFSPDGAMLASTSYDRTVKLWDPLTGDTIRTLRGHTRLITGVAFSPDGNILATASDDRTVKLWNPHTGDIIRTLWGHDNSVRCVAFSPDGNILASGSDDRMVWLWDRFTGDTIRTKRESSFVWGVAFSPHENILASGGSDGTVNLWDPRTGDTIHTLRGHTKEVYGVAFSPDGNILASASEDKTVKIWNPQTGDAIHTLRGHQLTGVYGVAFSPDGTMLASAGEDKTIKLWRVREALIQSDSSDAVFSIVEPLAEASDIDLGPCLVGSAKDSVVVDLVRNVGTYPFEVRSVSFTGPDAAAFALVAGIPTYRVDAATSHFGEFRFEPTRVGLHQAQLVIVTQSDTLVQNIQGTGVAPLLAIVNTRVDFGRIPLNTSKDTLGVATVRNVGNAPLTITDVRHAGPNDTDFTTIAGGGSFVLQPGDTHLMDLRFTANDSGRTSGTLEFSYNGVGSPAMVQLIAEGISTNPPSLDTISVDFGRVPIGTSKDTLEVATVRNVGNAPLTITDVRHAGPNDTDFTTIAGGGSFVLQPGDTHLMDLRFTANDSGRTSGTLEFTYNGVGSPAVVQLFAEGVSTDPTPLDTIRTTIALPNITAHAGQAIALPLAITKHSGIDHPEAPRNFVATIALNPTVVHVTDPTLACTAVNANTCEYTITGSRNVGDTLALIPAIATLGNTDYSPIQIVDFNWLDRTVPVVITTLDGSIRITDICDEGGTRLYVPGNTGYSLASRPNPAQSVAELQFGLAGAGPVVVDVIDQTGRLVLTPVNEAALPAGLHTRTVDVSTLSNGPYILLLRSGNTTLTSRLDVVR